MPGDLDRKISGQLASETARGPACARSTVQPADDERREARITGRSLAKIRVLRVVRELTQDELTQAAGVTRNQVSAFERTARRLDVVALIRLAAALEVSVPELLEASAPQPTRTDVPTGTVRSFGWDSKG